MNTRAILATFCALCLSSCFLAAAQERKQEPKAVASARDQETSAEATDSDGATPAAAPSPKPTPRSIEAAERIEGEKRFRTNCGRCHQPPHKFPPRVMATAIRHMRVRANITDEDQRLILKYMTQ